MADWNERQNNRDGQPSQAAGSSALWPRFRHAMKSDAWVQFGPGIVDSKRWPTPF